MQYNLLQLPYDHLYYIFLEENVKLVSKIGNQTIVLIITYLLGKALYLQRI